MKLPTNRERASQASHALDEYAEHTGNEDEDRKTVIIDLLSDLMHLCEIEDIDFDSCLWHANDHYTTESNEESDCDDETEVDSDET